MEIVPGLWQFTARHPEWTEDEGGAEGWEPDVNWWALGTASGLVLIDPLVEDWPALDRLVAAGGGCVAIIRSCHWHQRSIPEAAQRFAAPVWAARSLDGARWEPCDRELGDRERLPGEVVVARIGRADEVALWCSAHSTLLFGDAMLRDPGGRLRVCPESWSQPPDGRVGLLARLRRLAEHEPEHVLVSHGPLISGDGSSALRRALS